MTTDGEACADAGCSRAGAFWCFDPESDGWRPVCAEHARRLHPSLEVHAWLESGYLRPIELDRPEGPPTAPDHGRARAFREAVEEAMGWGG